MELDEMFNGVNEEFFIFAEEGMHARVSDLVVALDCSKLRKDHSLEDLIVVYEESLKKMPRTELSMEMLQVFERMKRVIQASKSLSAFSFDVLTHQRKHVKIYDKTHIERMVEPILSSKKELIAPPKIEVL